VFTLAYICDFAYRGFNFSRVGGKLIQFVSKYLHCTKCRNAVVRIHASYPHTKTHQLCTCRYRDSDAI